MEATTIIPETVQEPEEEAEDLFLEVPGPEVFVPCMSCGHRSWMHYHFMEDLMSYCKHHGERNHDALLDAGGGLVADYRDQII